MVIQKITKYLYVKYISFMKEKIRLTESDIQNIVKRSVKRVLNERKNVMVCDANKAQAIAQDIYREFDMMDSYGIDDIIRKYNPNCPPKKRMKWGGYDNF